MFIIQFLSSVLKENQLSNFKRMADTVIFDVFSVRNYNLISHFTSC